MTRYGSPKGRELFTALYKELTGKRGFAQRPCLLGRSRGGLWVTAWAEDNPDKVAGLAGIYPVFDLRTYPGLAKATPAYGLTAKELEARLGEKAIMTSDPIIGRRRFTDGSQRDLYADGHSQYVLDHDGLPVRGLRLLPDGKEETDRPA